MKNPIIFINDQESVTGIGYSLNVNTDKTFDRLIELRDLLRNKSFEKDIRSILISNYKSVKDIRIFVSENAINEIKNNAKLYYLSNINISMEGKVSGTATNHTFDEICKEQYEKQYGLNFNDLPVCSPKCFENIPLNEIEKCREEVRTWPEWFRDKNDRAFRKIFALPWEQNPNDGTYQGQRIRVR